ncbi:hypothetical protein BaRGS_00028948, partial [Batillaria attramentaria]
PQVPIHLPGPTGKAKGPWPLDLTQTKCGMDTHGLTQFDTDIAQTESSLNGREKRSLCGGGDALLLVDKWVHGYVGLMSPMGISYRHSSWLYRPISG